jgi:hypothetical protein
MVTLQSTRVLVETRGILRNVGCACNVDLRILDMIDSVVKTRGGRKRKDRD